jgi:4-amino-4-deoxy-L-arabinose transferase
VAALSIALLATSAGWVAYSGLCLTDLPLAVCFSLAVFLALPLLRAEPRIERIRLQFVLIGVCLGLAALAKGLVPLALFVPSFWFLRRYWRRWWLALVSCVMIAAPWYIAVYAYNGNQFVENFFWKHHIQRLYSASLQHAQPWYYYFPVLLGGLFPWTPLLGFIPFASFRLDERKRFLGAIFCFGFLLFSVSLNKLPGYLLPLVPSLFILIAAPFGTERALRVDRFWLVPCALLIAIIPELSRALPEWLSVGRFSLLPLKSFAWPHVLFFIAPAVAVIVSRRIWAFVFLVLCIAAGGIYLKMAAYPVLDREVSARGLWRHIRDLPGTVCDSGLNREWQFGLAFYCGSPLPYCRSGKFTYALQPRPLGPPAVELLNEAVGRSSGALAIK